MRTAAAAALALVTLAACVPSTEGSTARGSGVPSSPSSRASRSATSTHRAASSTRATPSSSPPDRCTPRGVLPDRRCTPGAVNRRVIQANIGSTICRSGYSASVRPPTSYTTPIKRAMLGTEVVTLHLKGEGGRPVDVTVRPYGPYAGSDLADYELDHLVAIEDGGDPWLVENLWLEAEPGGHNPKDGVENRLHQALCAGRVSLDDARQALATDWQAADAVVLRR